MRALVLALLLPLTAHAQRYVNVPVCFPPYSPPADGMIVYEDGVAMQEYAPTCKAGVVRCTGQPFWAPNGGQRTSFWYGMKGDTKVLTFTVTRGAQESPMAQLATLPDIDPGLCWMAPTDPNAVLALKTPSEKLADLGKICLGDPACAQLVLDACTNSAACKAALAPKLQSDFDNSGRIDATDALWWNATISGQIR